MIVVDTNTITYFIIRGQHSMEADRVYQRDSEWAAPALWRSEFRNVLAVSLRRGLVDFGEALGYMDHAELVIRGREYQVASARVLKLAADSGCSAYDCEFVGLAQDLGVPLVTTDKEVLAKFTPTAISPKAFCS